MPSLYLTQTRITKPGRTPATRRHSSSPFGSHPRTKALQRSKAVALGLDDGLDDHVGRLDATGKVLTKVSVAEATNVLTALQYASANMFSDLPDRAGMNSVRIAEVLNFQKSMPPVASVAHVHGLLSASSRTEREISTLQSTGKLRKVKLSGRGNDISGTSEVLVTIDSVQTLLRQSSVPDGIAAEFISLLSQHPRATSISGRLLTPFYIAALTKAGFLVSGSLSGSRNTSLSGSAVVATPSISRAMSGTFAAVGGEAAFEQLGGVGGPRRSSEPLQAGELALSVPNLGPYLRLITAGREHLLELLGKSKYKEAPLYLLKERWDGAVDSDSRVSLAKQVRGEFSGIMPARTKKWKDLSGLNFDFAVEECLGAGLIELFETHSVGLGIRALT